jgi:hypothetical protein
MNRSAIRFHVLTQDVHNPEPRRLPSDWRCAKFWTAGMRFRSEIRSAESDDATDEIWLAPTSDLHRVLRSTSRGQDLQFQALWTHLEECAPTTRELLDLYELEAETVLDVMQVTEAQIAAVAANIDTGSTAPQA